MIKNIHYDKNEKIVYNVQNYLTEINDKLYDINNLDNNIDCTLYDLKKLKNEFKEYFFKYNLEEYEVTYNKIKKIEEDIYSSKKKISIIRTNLIKNKEINSEALKKVRKLNN